MFPSVLEAYFEWVFLSFRNNTFYVTKWLTCTQISFNLIFSSSIHFTGTLTFDYLATTKLKFNWIPPLKAGIKNRSIRKLSLQMTSEFTSATAFIKSKVNIGNWGGLLKHPHEKVLKYSTHRVQQCECKSNMVIYREEAVIHWPCSVLLRCRLCEPELHKLWACTAAIGKINVEWSKNMIQWTLWILQMVKQLVLLFPNSFQLYACIFMLNWTSTNQSTWKI